MHGVSKPQSDETKPAAAPRAAAPALDDDIPLYADRVRVYPRRVEGKFRTLKWSLLIAFLAIYYFAAWIRWDRGPNAPDQALLIDMSGRRGYFFGIEIWPQEVYYITGLLILGAFGLFLATALAGRVWCGYACPQTVWTDLFMWIERLIEGDRTARIRRDKGPLTASKAMRKALKHGAWVLISLATGGAWVIYFGDAPSMLREVFTGQSSTEVYFFVGLFTSTTYLLAGWAREQVCTYMCPWPRFQAAMLDEQSLVVSYRKWRGEPRGALKRAMSWENRGDCVDCRACIHVCPTGIDIRDGQQLECIGCGLCIDACDTVMDRVKRKRGLIAFDTLANLEAKAAGLPYVYKLWRPRVLVYLALLLITVGVMTAGLLFRTDLEVHVLRDRAPLFVALSNGDIRNGYTLKVLNKTRADRVFDLAITGLPGAKLTIQGGEGEALAESRLNAAPDAVATYRVYVAVAAEKLKSESSALRFELKDRAGGKPGRYDAVFLGPKR
ncbi:MAG: cytochrome c oxidase accessory protein CcoG [Alphaproteobacteria bacterium]|nr:cytochrome c oxidase accessory protein CcoG [Alphaproteobacteria bacterium]